MNTKLKLTSGQLLQIIRLAKDNKNLDIDLLVRAMGLVEKEADEEPRDEPKEVSRPIEVEKETDNLNRRWSGDDDEKLLFLYLNTDLKINQIGKQLGRSGGSVNTRLNRLREDGRLNIYRTGQKGVAGKAWTQDEDFFLREELSEHKEPKNVPKDNIELLSKLFNRTFHAVVSRLYTLHKEEK